MRCAKCLKVVYRWQATISVKGWAHCPFCLSRICLLCGCTNDRACRLECDAACTWQDANPAVCSNHTAEEVAALRRGN